MSSWKGPSINLFAFYVCCEICICSGHHVRWHLDRWHLDQQHLDQRHVCWRQLFGFDLTVLLLLDITEIRTRESLVGSANASSVLSSSLFRQFACMLVSCVKTASRWLIHKSVRAMNLPHRRWRIDIFVPLVLVELSGDTLTKTSHTCASISEPKPEALVPKRSPSK